MAKKRTRRQKEAASRRLVNSQFAFTFEPKIKGIPKKEKSIDTAKLVQIASIKKDLLKSLIVAFLILISLVVLYWFSRS